MYQCVCTLLRHPPSTNTIKASIFFWGHCPDLFSFVNRPRLEEGTYLFSGNRALCKHWLATEYSDFQQKRGKINQNARQLCALFEWDWYLSTNNLWPAERDWSTWPQKWAAKGGAWPLEQAAFIRGYDYIAILRITSGKGREERTSARSRQHEQKNRRTDNKTGHRNLEK